jgi:hypothetical protein
MVSLSLRSARLQILDRESYLADAITIMAAMEMLVLAWFRRPASEFDWIDASEVGSDGSNGLECKCCGSFGTVKDNWLPHTEPVLKMVNVGALDVGVKVIRVDDKE